MAVADTARAIISIDRQRTLTKKDRKTTARQIIDRNRIDMEFCAADVYALNAVLETSYAGFKRKRNPLYPSDPRHLYAKTGDDWQAFGWNKAIDGEDKLRDVKKVMRSCVAEVMREFLSEIDDPSCECCGEESDLTVDHTPAFDMVVARFVEQYGMPEIKDDPHGVGHMFADIDDEAKWCEFHASRVMYGVLCRSCNASKGMTGACRLHSK